MAREGLKRRARNQLPRVITAIQKNDIVAQVELRVGDNMIVAVITANAVDKLGLQVGEEATALIKSTAVMIIAKDGDIGGR
jgi:molybdate transport system regulatory protein